VGARKPNINSLARRRDVAGLVKAASYTEAKRAKPGSLTDPGSAVRSEAILALGALDQDSGHGAVEAGLRDPADSVRSAAVHVLHARHDGTALAQALRSLPAEDGESRDLAMLAILDLRPAVSAVEVAGALVHAENDELLGEQDARLFIELVADAPADEGDAAIRVLIEALGDGRGIVVDRAAELLVRLAPTTIDALIDELRTGPSAADAAYVLGRIGDPETIDVLIEALRDDDPRVRSECTAALSEFDAHDAVKPLLEAARDPDHGVRVQAGLALDRMGPSAVIVGVATLLEPMIQEAVRSAQRQRRPRGPQGESLELTAPRPSTTQRAR
jgi:HEAT repeat protein